MKFFEKLLKKFANQNVLYYPGCMTKRIYKEYAENYKKIFNKIGIDFIELKQAEQCCGSPVLSAGYKKDFDRLVKQNTDTFNEYGIKKIITNCPACYRILKENYPSFEVEHVSVTINNAIKEGKLKLKKISNEKITYHDPCHLGRQGGVYEEPRFILQELGFKIIEMRNHHENSLCCGAGAGLRNNNPNLSNKIGKLRIGQAEELKVKKLITTCPMCHYQLQNSTNKIKVIELSEVVLDGLQ